MGRLFWKFFFTIWCAWLTAGFVVWLTMTIIRPSPSLELEGGPHATFMIETISTLLEKGDIKSACHLITRWDQIHSHGMHILAVNEQNVDLLGRAVPVPTLNHARLLAYLDSLETDESKIHRSSEIVRSLMTPDHQRWTLFIPKHLPNLDPLAPGITPFPSHPPPHKFHPHGIAPPPGMLIISGLIASFVFSALLAWYFSKPIRNLRWAFQSLAEGHLNTRVQSLMGRRRDEIADLGRDFDRMANKIHHLVESQRRLLHDVSHEFRSPLARLQVAIDLTRQDPSRMMSTLERVEYEAIRLNILVEELLTLSRLEAGTNNPQKIAFDLVELVSTVAEDAKFEAHADNRDLNFTGHGEIMILGDRELLHRAIENIVRNAIKYTPQNTAVMVTIKKNTDQAILQILDCGQGVPEDELETIFIPFHRCHHNISGGGFGLGCAITRRAVEAHHGSIHAFNRPEGGLCVEIRLPTIRNGI